MALAVLDGGGTASEVVNGVHDPLLPLALQGHPGQPLVDGHTALEGRTGRPQGGGAVPFPGLENSVGQGHAGVAGQGAQEELIVVVGHEVGADYQVARRLAAVRQRVGVRKELVRAGQRTAFEGVEDRHQLLEGGPRSGAVGRHFVPPRTEHDPVRPAWRERGHGRGHEVQDATGLALLSQQGRQQQQGAQAGKRVAAANVVARR